MVAAKNKLNAEEPEEMKQIVKQNKISAAQLRRKMKRKRKRKKKRKKCKKNSARIHTLFE